MDREIGRLVDKHRLLEEVRRLKADLDAAISVATLHRGHNNPPELLGSADAEMAALPPLVMSQLEEAEEELQRKRPSSSRLRRIGLAIRDAVASALSSSALSYCGSLADAALKEAAKKFGAAAGMADLAYLGSHNAELMSLADALITFAQKLLG